MHAVAKTRLPYFTSNFLNFTQQIKFYCTEDLLTKTILSRFPLHVDMNWLMVSSKHGKILHESKTITVQNLRIHPETFLKIAAITTFKLLHSLFVRSPLLKSVSVLIHSIFSKSEA